MSGRTEVAEGNDRRPHGFRQGSLREVASVFLKLGLIAFGGPAAHVALMRREVVERRQWVTEQEFLDLFAASNLIPGPTSTEMAIFLGYRRAGPKALVLAGTLFILPAMLVVLALAWAYVHYGTRPQATWLLYGVKPVMIAVILQAIWSLARPAIKGPVLAVTIPAVLVLYLLGVSPLYLLFGAGLLLVLLRNAGRTRRFSLIVMGLLPGIGLGVLVTPAAAAQQPFSLQTLFLTFLKIGAVLYGSGYVLLAFLRADFVVGLHWLTDQQLVDAIAVGQFTPGPVFTTATFIGYLLGSWWGAVLATIGIFLPSFVFVTVVYPLVPHLRRSAMFSTFLDGVSAAALGLMAAVTAQLAKAALVDWFTVCIALAAVLALIRFNPSSVWVIVTGGSLGLAYHLVAG